MKVIHCLNHFLPGKVAGTEVYVQALVHQLRPLGIDSLVLIPHYGSTVNERYEIDGIRVVKYAEPSEVDRSLKMGKRVPDGLKHFMEVLHNEQPDVVHFHDIAGSNGITMLHVRSSRKAGFRNIMTLHIARYSCMTGNLMYKNEQYCDGTIIINKCTKCNFYVNGLGNAAASVLFPVAALFKSVGYNTTKWNSKLGTAIGYPFVIEQLRSNLHNLAGDCSKLVVLTKWYRDVLLRNNIAADKLLYIPQAVPVSHAEAHTPRAAAWPLKIMFIGRINQAKGVHLLIDAVKTLSPASVMLDIYGPDYDDAYVNECKASAKDFPHIRWKGLLPPALVHDTLTGYDLLCVPSVVCEMSPLVIQEAFAAKVPVIGSDVAGNREQISEGRNGWLFAFNNAASLEGILKKITGDPSLIDEARKNIPVVNVFGQVAKSYHELYSQLNP